MIYVKEFSLCTAQTKNFIRHNAPLISGCENIEARKGFLLKRQEERQKRKAGLHE
jgi:hypothetical protein